MKNPTHEQVALVVAALITALTESVKTLRDIEAAASKPIVNALVQGANTVVSVKDNLPIALAAKSRVPLVVAMQTLLAGGTIADAEAACGVKTVRQWCVIMGGVKAARSWAANHLHEVVANVPTQSIATAVPAVNDPRPPPMPALALTNATGSSAIHEAIRVAGAYCKQRTVDGKGFRIRHDVFAYGKAANGGLYALIRGVKKDGTFTNVHALLEHDGKFVSVKQGTHEWNESILVNATQMPPQTVFGGGAKVKSDPVGSFFA